MVARWNRRGARFSVGWGFGLLRDAAFNTPPRGLLLAPPGRDDAVLKLDATKVEEALKALREL